MNKKLPSIKFYIPVSAGICLIAAIAPFAFDFEFGASVLTWQKRVGQSGVLLTYIAAIFGAMSFFWDTRVSNRLEAANRSLSHNLAWLDIIRGLNQRHDLHEKDMAKYEQLICESRDEIQQIGDYP